MDSGGAQGGARRVCGTWRHAGDLTSLWSSMKTTRKPVGAGSVLFKRNLFSCERRLRDGAELGGATRGPGQTPVTELGDQVLLDSQKLQLRKPLEEVLKKWTVGVTNELLEALQESARSMNCWRWLLFACLFV